jgi:hypothetical protein
MFSEQDGRNEVDPKRKKFRENECLTLTEEFERAVEQLRPELEQFWCCVGENTSGTQRAYSAPLPEERQPEQDQLLRVKSEPVRSQESQPNKATLHFRGSVLLSAKPGVGFRASICSFNTSHIVLASGENWLQELVKLPLCHVIFTVHEARSSSFEMMVISDSTFGCDTRISLDVSSPAARHRWLSALWDCDATIQGWDVATGYCQPKSHRGTFKPAVMWLN